MSQVQSVSFFGNLRPSRGTISVPSMSGTGGVSRGQPIALISITGQCLTERGNLGARLRVVPDKVTCASGLARLAAEVGEPAPFARRGRVKDGSDRRLLLGSCSSCSCVARWCWSGGGGAGLGGGQVDVDLDAFGGRCDASGQRTSRPYLVSIHSRCSIAGESTRGGRSWSKVKNGRRDATF